MIIPDFWVLGVVKIIKIELRKDGWFEAGHDCKENFPFAYLCYLGKQELKKNLEGIGPVKSIDKLIGKICEIKELDRAMGDFKGRPYLIGNDIMIDTHGLPGRCYLGSITEKK